MRFTTRRILELAVCTALFTSMAVSQKNNTPEAMLRAAKDKETVDGDMKAAIDLYKKVIAQKGASKEVVATALVRLGAAYEKKGSLEARPVYERVIREFSDHPEAFQQARSRLDAIPKMTAGLSIRPVCTGADCNGILSPNARYIANDFGNPIVRDLTAGQTRPITNVPDGYIGRASKWAPDSKRVAFTETSFATGREQIVVANLEVSTQRTIFSAERAVTLDWSPDGRRLLVLEYGKGPTPNLLWVSVADGKAEKLTEGLWVLGASISPDGRYIGYGATKNANSSAGTDLRIMANDGSGDTPIVASPTSGMRLPVGWSPDGKYLIYAQSDSSLWAVPITDGKPGISLKLRMPVGKDPVSFDGLYDRALYFKVSINTADILTASIDLGTGRITSQAVPLPVSHNERMGQPHWSPDGKKIIYYSGGNEISVYSFESGKDQRVASNIGPIQFEVCWSGDNSSILVNGVLTSGATQAQPIQLNLTTGEARPLFPGNGNFRLRSCARELIADMNNTAIKVRNLDTGTETEVHKYGRNQQRPSLPYLSHDSKSLAFTEVLEDGSTALLVVSTQGGPSHELLRLRAPMAFVGPHGIEWSTDDRFVYFVKKPDSKSLPELFRVSVLDGNEESTGFKLPDLVGIEISPDGKRIVLSTNGGQRTEIWSVENFVENSLPAPATKK